MEYFNTFCSHDKEKILFLRSWLKLLIHNYTHTQTFLTIIGGGGTEKTVLETTFKALVGERNTVTSTLSAMNNDRFELINFKNKSLVTISDSDRVRGINLGPLKMLTGCDRIQGRIKLTQGCYDFTFSGLVMITSNYELDIDDPSGAIYRRMRVLYANNVIKPSEQKILIAKDHTTGKWMGDFSHELYI